ncbi:MAG: diadenylate cyclase CdaA [Candidatus Eisenbacteria bacterium]|nr:diadenylate cyclase CdaA [Candidatus Eisenbacteria bacterium]
MGDLQFRIYDVIDFAVVWFLLYRLLLVVKGTRASQMFVGLALIYLVSAVADVFQLTGLNRIFSSLKTVWLVGFVILFQPELRRALSQVGQGRIFRIFLKIEAIESMDEIAKAVQVMARKRIGGLIVIVRQAALRNIIETGHRVDGKVTAEMIVTVFTNYSPLHDGALVIQNDRIAAAGCILPLSQDRTQTANTGTRHRAALGLAEETDAIVIVVSEETGAISIANRGVIRRVADDRELVERVTRIVQAGKKGEVEEEES